MTYRAEKLAELRQQLEFYHTKAAEQPTQPERDTYATLANEVARALLLLLTKKGR